MAEARRTAPVVDESGAYRTRCVAVIPSLVLGYGFAIDLVAAARDEVIGQHEFFVGWFTGSLGESEHGVDRFADSLHPEFSMIAPSGVVLDRDAVVASIRGAHGTADPSFEIEIRDVVERLVSSDAVVVGYEEWQFVGGLVTSCRVCSAVLVRTPGADVNVRWRHLHETFRRADPSDTGQSVGG